MHPYFLLHCVSMHDYRPPLAQLPEQREGGLELLHGACPLASSLEELPMQQPGCQGASDGAHRWLSCEACLRLTEAEETPGYIQCRLCRLSRPFAGPFCSCITPAAPALAVTSSVPLKDQPAPQPNPTLTKLATPPEEAVKKKKNVSWLKGLVSPVKRQKPNFLSRISSGESKQELLTQNGAAFTIADDEPHALLWRGSAREDGGASRGVHGRRRGHGSLNLQRARFLRCFGLASTLRG